MEHCTDGIARNKTRCDRRWANVVGAIANGYALLPFQEKSPFCNF
jgi:hypothetical protein